LLLVSLVVSSFRVKPAPSNVEAASDFHQRHPGWTWSVRESALVSSDYFQRHPELTAPSVIGIGASDYFQRHHERYDKMNKVPIPSFRDPIATCFDVSISELAACREASQAAIQLDHSAVDECFDVSLWEEASCRNAGP
jgi:hypothetical protein